MNGNVATPANRVQRGVAKTLRQGAAVLDAIDLHNFERRVRQHHWSIGLRQIHGAEIDLRPYAADQRDHSRGRHDAAERARNRLFYFSGCDAASLAHRARQRRSGSGA